MALHFVMCLQKSDWHDTSGMFRMYKLLENVPNKIKTPFSLFVQQYKGMYMYWLDSMFSVIKYYKSKSEISYDDVFLTFFFKSCSVETTTSPIFPCCEKQLGFDIDLSLLSEI